MKVVVSGEVAASPEQVFDFLVHHENHAIIFAENVSCRRLDEGPLIVGARVENVARVMGRTMVERFVITELERPRTIAKQSGAGSTFETTDRFDLEESPGGGTRVTVSVTGTPSGLGQRLIMPLLAPMMRRSLGRALDALANALGPG